MDYDYDIIIMGGGLVGATLACALGRPSMGHGAPRVAVVEAAPPADDWDPETYELRVSAITCASQRIFTALGVWPDIARRRVCPFREMQVWDATGSGTIHFDSADIGESTLGHIIENRVMQLALWEGMQRCENVELLCPASLESLSIDGDSARVQIDDGRSFTARLLVGADGSASRVRELAGIASRGWSYDQQAVVATVSVSAGHHETAWQRFLPDGPLAFLPLRDNHCSIVWSTSPEQAAALLEMEDEAFLEALQESFGDRLGRMESVGPRGAFPLRLQHAEQYVMPRVALVGDAAHTVHPLAGQGVNLGLADAACLAEVLFDGGRTGRDPGALRVLRRYERWRKGDNVGMALTMDGFKRLFGSRAPGVRWLRNTGLSLTDAAQPVKNLIMRHAMGMSGDLPRLSRGRGLSGNGGGADPVRLTPFN